MTTLTLLCGSLNARQKRSLSVKGDCALDQMVTSSPAFHSTMATWVSNGTCCTEGLVYSRSMIHFASAKPASTSPLRILVMLGMLVPGCGLKDALT
jgi:hypothetical protein